MSCVWPCCVSLLLCLPFHLCLSLCPQGGLPQWQWLSVTGYLLPLLLPMHLGRLQGGRVPQPPTPGTPALYYAAQPGLPGPCRAPEQWSCFSLGGRHPGQDLPQLPASIQALPPPETLRSPWSSEPLFRACLPLRPFSRLLFWAHSQLRCPGYLQPCSFPGPGPSRPGLFGGCLLLLSHLLLLFL